MATVSESPVTPKSGLYTCLACHVAFPTSERQRSHYRTDWHKYNLKRKIAELEPITAEQFTEKVLASQAKGREDAERMGLIYECPVCRKSYYSENAFNNHVQSRKHKEMELLAQAEQEEEDDTDGDQEEDENIEENAITEKQRKSKGSAAERPHPLLECLFCGRTNEDFESNMQHMKLSHGFFLPDLEYLKDPEGLIMYLSNKIYDNICLYCNGRGKQWRSVEAVRAHMVATGHTKMAYDESENPEDLLRYYDFGNLKDLSSTTTAPENVDDKHKELILPSGSRVGHRRFLKYYKQHHVTKEKNDKEASLVEESDSKLESLQRRERRAKLAITDGREEQHSKRYEGIKQAAAKQQFQHQFGVKHNINNTLRMRDQVPK